MGVFREFTTAVCLLICIAHNEWCALTVLFYALWDEFEEKAVGEV